MESKKEKFVRLAEARTNKILKMIELLGNLSNTSSYEYTEEDVNRIYDRIFNELNISKERYGFGLRRKPEAFSLSCDEVKFIEHVRDECKESNVTENLT